MFFTHSKNYTGKIEIYELNEPATILHERALIFKTPNSRFGISSRSDVPINFSKKTLVLQYEIRAPRLIKCTGAYIKLFYGPNFNPIGLTNETKQAIIFGPDICGSKSEILFGFNHLNPFTNKYTEKFIMKPPKFFSDGYNHIFTLIIRPNNTFEILLDNNIIKSGDYFSSFEPSIIPSQFIPDPNIKKPLDWDDNEFIIDNNATKPIDWDENAPEFINDFNLTPPSNWLINEPLMIIDDSIEKPKEWDDKLFGEFIQPLKNNPKCINNGCGPFIPPIIKNPNFKGKWSSPKILNPNFKGKWNHPLIKNPEYFIDQNPYLLKNIQGIGFELLSTEGGLAVKNIILSTDEKSIKEWNKNNFLIRKQRQLTFQHNVNEPNKELPNKPIEPTSTNLSYKIVIRHSYFMVIYAIKNLFNESKIGTLIVTSILMIIPILIYLIIYRRK